MAQTQNGEAVYKYYHRSLDVLEFANDWCNFSIYYGHNVCLDWNKYCDEFAEWVMLFEDLDPAQFGLTFEGREE